MADVIASSVVGKLAEYTVSPVLRQIKYLFFYNSNIQNLRNKAQELENKRNDVERRVVAAERNTEITREEVSAWLPKVDDLMERADKVLKGVAGSEMRCLFNRFPNLKSRYLLSRRATKLTIEADNLKAAGTFDWVCHPPSPVQELNPTSHMVFETRSSTKKKIKEALKDKDISIIGICGMPGVGKTTMANEIVKEVKEEKLFEEVAFAVVSNHLDINHIQNQLAEMLGLKFVENTNEGRARRLHQRLEVKDGKSILVVLDDVWKTIDLGTIGIPSPHDRKGLKIMFTTRIEEMWSKMKAQRKFEIEVLDKKEGWQLFKDEAGISDDETDVELLSIAKKVADECGCLPLALVVVGKAMENKGIRKWRDALQQLQNSNVTNLEGHDFMYSRIELSYKQLESDEDRDLLLLCSLFAEDESIPIEILVRYARGLTLFPNTDTLEETRDRAYSIALNLKSYYLLQTGRVKDEVKLHDVIRDFCLWKANEDKRGYLVKHAGLIEWPEHDVHESYSAISITFDELGQLPSGLKYQNVKLLRLICRKFKECNISEEFFKDMKDLRVLELKGMYIQIPSSLQLLTGLQTLCLIHCNIHSQLSMIGSLKKLEILSFYRSFYNYSRIEFTNLCNLRSLDLRFHELNCPLRPGVLSGMKKLEELCLGCIPKEGEDQKCIIEELSSLTSLHTFQISTLDPILMQILKARCLENLDKFQILGATTPLPDTEDQYFTRSLSLKDGIDASMLSLPVFNSLMNRTYHLHIKGAKVLKNVVSELDGDGFINLKTLDLLSGDFEYLIDATNSIPNGTFGKLESLELNNLPKLIEICNGNLPRGVIRPQLFCNLVRVEMSSCRTIRSLFPQSVANNLVNLHWLYIEKCPMLEEVVSTDARENEVTETCKMLEFPKLKKVTLGYLSRFKSITSQSNSGVVHQTLFNRVTFPNMEELNVSGLDCIVKLLGKEMPITSLHKLNKMRVFDCNKLMTIAKFDSIRLLQNLVLLHVSGCGALEVLFDFEGIKVTNDDAEINMLGQLRSLYLSNLPKLVHITRMVPKGISIFQNLKSLDVRGCESLRYLFSPSIVNSLVALEYLSIKHCKALEEIIGREEDEKEENTSEKRNIIMDANAPSNLHHFTQVVSMDAKRNEVIDMPKFPKLRTIRLRDLSSFKSFGSETNNDGILQTLFNQVTSKSLQNLETLVVKECKALEVVFDFECLTTPEDHVESVFGRLSKLELKSLDKLVHIIGTIPKGIRVFENLTSIVVERCGILKYLFSPSMANSLVVLNVLEVSDCGSIEEIIGKEEGTSEIKIVEGIKTTIVFPNLNRLLLENLSSIQMFCSQNYQLEFPLLKDFAIENCPKMEKLSPWPVSAPKLDISQFVG